MTLHNMNANLTKKITEARSNVGNFSKTGGKWVSGRTPFIHPQNFLTYAYILWSKIAKLSSQKVSTEYPQKIHAWIRVVNFDSDGKSDQKIDIFSANQFSAFLQQLTPPFRRFFRKKSDWEWRQLIFLRVGGEDMVKAVSLVTWAEAGSNWCEIEKWADVVLSASISSFIISYVGGAPEAHSKKIAKEQIFIAR